MASMHGNNVAQSHSEGTVWATNNAWRQLIASGTTPYRGRQWVEIQNKGPAALAFRYVDRSADGTFATPTGGPGLHMVIPRNSIKVFPLGDACTIFGLAYGKAGSTSTGSKIIVVEFK